mmetsp:Transcript_19925/g.49935  ORF Transcript_19925/g.49935 Transcript_19925/m.49935 type:complete len:335 (+) Transcript_19925:132-1136(+)
MQQGPELSGRLALTHRHPAGLARQQLSNLALWRVVAAAQLGRDAARPRGERVVYERADARVDVRVDLRFVRLERAELAAEAATLAHDHRVEVGERLAVHAHVELRGVEQQGELLALRCDPLGALQPNEALHLLVGAGDVVAEVGQPGAAHEQQQRLRAALRHAHDVERAEEAVHRHLGRGANGHYRAAECGRALGVDVHLPQLRVAQPWQPLAQPRVQRPVAIVRRRERQPLRAAEEGACAVWKRRVQRGELLELVLEPGVLEGVVQVGGNELGRLAHQRERGGHAVARGERLGSRDGAQLLGETCGVGEAAVHLEHQPWPLVHEGAVGAQLLQ